MKILMLVLAYYENDARVRRYAESLHQDGHLVEVIALRGPGKPARETLCGVEVRRVPMARRRGGMLQTFLEYLFFFFWGFIYISLSALRNKPAIVHIHNMPDFLVFTALLPRLRGSKIVLDVHDLMPEVFASKTGLPVVSSLILPLRLEERLSLGVSDRVIFATEIFRRLAVDRGSTKIEDSLAIMNVADPTLFDAKKHPWTGPEDPNEFRVLYLGTITHRHGVDQIVRVLPLVREAIPGIRFVVHPRLAAGEGRPLQELEELAAELGVADLLRIERALSLEEVPEVMSQASVGAFTPHQDVHIDMALSLKVPEFVAMGLPIIAVRTRIMESLFQDGEVLYFEDGELEQFARHLIYLHRHPDAARDMAKRARRFLSEHSWQQEYQRYGKMLEELTGQQIKT
ncbi:MAG: hypothetical protein CSA62_08560 [Planctomycetota bacterium]|nr:MAG: hypothetical protein CSA62_08560 [Planctomycetota bacterium]